MYNPIPPPRPSLLLLSSIPPSPMPPRAASRIALQLSHLHERARVFELRSRPGDAFCENTLKMRLPISTNHRNQLKKSSLKPHD
jgi:hypothetical protein